MARHHASGSPWNVRLKSDPIVGATSVAHSLQISRRRRGILNVRLKSHLQSEGQASSLRCGSDFSLTFIPEQGQAAIAGQLGSPAAKAKTLDVTHRAEDAAFDLDAARRRSPCAIQDDDGSGSPSLGADTCANYLKALMMGAIRASSLLAGARSDDATGADDGLCVGGVLARKSGRPLPG